MNFILFLLIGKNMEEKLKTFSDSHNGVESEEEEDECEKNHISEDDPSIADKINQKHKCSNILIIDGAYFEIGIKELEKANPNNQCLSNPHNIQRLMTFIEEKSGVKSFDWKSFHTAEEPNVKKPKSYYSVLKSDGFHFDIRDYKSKKVKWPNKNCRHYNKAFKTKVQAEVDVAITMTTMELLSAYPEIKNVVFVIGDRDFNDLFRYLKKINVSTYIFGFRSNLSGLMFKIFPAERIFYINDSWEKYINSSIDEEFPPLASVHIKPIESRHINLGKKWSDSKPKIMPDSSPLAKKKKNRKPKNNGTNQKEEEVKRKSICMKEHTSHSSTKDSAIEKQCKVNIYFKFILFLNCCVALKNNH